eukprot:TRINITY_DN2060_c0_g1_i1.p1 TRINITY_DN2060_c0_g1~~TRINITY_DN2060_c0_g1_i1.p1  ORF type:complete len:339 (-),score=99.78 TRINITY_DN2060_c0_g1_i1:222-1238(-)
MATKSMFDMSDDELDDHDNNEGVEHDVKKLDEKENSPKLQKGEDETSNADEFSDDDDFCAAIEDIEKEPVEEEKTEEKKEMTKAEKDRAERNRLKALTLKKSRLLAHPYAQANGHNTQTATQHKSKKVVDSGGGFFIEGDEEEDEKAVTYVDGPAPYVFHDRPTCEECEKKFDDSFLLRTFDHSVCDKCRDTGKDGDHELITRTEAKSTFLLKDFDLEKCEHGEALKFIVKKNPHNPRGGEMKLYLRMQVEERAVQIWGSQEALEAEIEAREEKKVEAKSRKYNRNLKALRMAARSSLYKKDISAHVHEYTDEVYHEDKDEYSQTCATCGHINTYEKM